jgi:predicted ATPase
VERPPDAASNRYGLYEDLRRYELLETVATVLGRTAAARPLLLVIDDLHWATKPTLLMLRHVLRRNRATRLLVIGTYRPPSEASAGPGLGDFLTDLRRELQFDVLRLAGLDGDETADLVTDLLGAPRRRVSSRCTTALTATHFYRRDGARDHRRRLGRRPARCSRSAGIRAGAGKHRGNDRLRVSRLAPETQELLGVASVVGPSASLDVLEAVADVGDVVAAVEEGLDAGLLAEGEQATQSPSRTRWSARCSIRG